VVVVVVGGGVGWGGGGNTRSRSMPAESRMNGCLLTEGTSRDAIPWKVLMYTTVRATIVSPAPVL
jgi:hypothetical protein